MGNEHRITGACVGKYAGYIGSSECVANKDSRGDNQNPAQGPSCRLQDRQYGQCPEEEIQSKHRIGVFHAGNHSLVLDYDPGETGSSYDGKQEIPPWHSMKAIFSVEGIMEKGEWNHQHEECSPLNSERKSAPKSTIKDEEGNEYSND